MPEQSLQKTVRIAAMDILARREHSALELQQKLVRKFPELELDTVIAPAITQLQLDNLQCDARFAQAYVRYRSQRGMGPLKIMAELRPRGISPDVLREAIYGEIDWVGQCALVLAKKFKTSGKPAAAEVAKWQRFLAQRGFESDQCRQAIRQLEDSSQQGHGA